jgi:predicted O-methyltransferase YrrM
MSTASKRDVLQNTSDDQARILDEIFQDDGYFIADILDAEGLAELRRIVNDKFHSAIKLKYPELYNEFAELSANQYHLKSALIDHANMWRKAMRTFDHALVERFLALPWRRRLAERVGSFELLGLEEVGLPDIYMRVVRPDAPSDVGPIHADQWFTDLGNHSYDPGLALIKVWIPVYSEPAKDGLIGVPGSHLQPIHYESELRDGYVKPVLPKEVEARLEPIRLPAAPGQAVCFRYDFLHGGTVNEGTNTRVSLEATLVLNRQRVNGKAKAQKLEQPSRGFQTPPQLAADWDGSASEFLRTVRLRGSTGLNRLVSRQNLELPVQGVNLDNRCDAAKVTLFKALLPSGKDVRILMLGSDYGLMASAVGEQLTEASGFTIVETERKVADMTVRNIARQNLDKVVSVVQGEYQKVVPYLAKSIPYDVIVLDTKAHALISELLAWLSQTGRMLVDGVLDDTGVLRPHSVSQPASSAREILDKISAREDLWATLLPVSMGVLLVVRA